MKNKKEVGLGVLITILLFVTSILIAMFIVKNKISSNASNDGWLGFFGGLFGSFISGMITFYVLYIDRKGSREQIFKQQKVMEMNQMENDLRNYNRITDKRQTLRSCLF